MRRHKVQTIVITVVLLVATASATLGLALLAATNGPFTHAFGAQRGADVTVTVNAARATNAELAATGSRLRGDRRWPGRSPRPPSWPTSRASPGGN